MLFSASYSLQRLCSAVFHFFLKMKASRPKYKGAFSCLSSKSGWNTQSIADGGLSIRTCSQLGSESSSPLPASRFLRSSSIADKLIPFYIQSSSVLNAANTAGRDTHDSNIWAEKVLTTKPNGFFMMQTSQILALDRSWPWQVNLSTTLPWTTARTNAPCQELCRFLPPWCHGTKRCLRSRYPVEIRERGSTFWTLINSRVENHASIVFGDRIEVARFIQGK